MTDEEAAKLKVGDKIRMTSPTTRHPNQICFVSQASSARFTHLVYYKDSEGKEWFCYSKDCERVSGEAYETKNI